MKIHQKNSQRFVTKVFQDVSEKYDLMNDVMSLGVHRLWKDEFCRMIPNLNSTILDVAGGTGDISFRLKDNAKKQNTANRLISLFCILLSIMSIHHIL